MVEIQKCWNTFRQKSLEELEALKGYLKSVDFLKNYKGENKKSININFSGGGAEIAYIEEGNANYVVYAYDIKDGLSQEGAWEEALISFIKNFIEQNAILTKDVVMNISESESVFIKYLTLPALSKKEILGAAKWQLKEESPFDLENASMDWQVIKESPDAEGKKSLGIIFIAIKKEAMDRCLYVLEQCELNLQAVTNSAFNCSPLLQALPQSPSIATVLDIGDKESTLSFYIDNKLNFIRILPVSHEKLLWSLTRALGTDKGKIELTLEQAADIEKNIGIVQNGTSIPHENLHPSHIQTLMRPFLEALVRELKFSFDYFQSTFGVEKPLGLFLTGSGAGLKHLDSYLKNALKMDVAYLSLPGSVALKVPDKEKFRDDEQKILSALGASLGKFTLINLLPREIKLLKEKHTQLVSLAAASVLITFYLIISLLVVFSQIQTYQNKIKETQLTKKSLEHIKGLIMNIKEKDKLVNAIQEDKTPAEGALKVISLLIPPEIVLDELLFNQKGHRVSLKGQVLPKGEGSKNALTSFIEQLEESPFFNEVDLNATQWLGLIERFDIDCELAY